MEPVNPSPPPLSLKKRSRTTQVRSLLVFSIREYRCDVRFLPAAMRPPAIGEHGVCTFSRIGMAKTLERLLSEATLPRWGRESR